MMKYSNPQGPGSEKGILFTQYFTKHEFTGFIAGPNLCPVIHSCAAKQQRNKILDSRRQTLVRGGKQ